MSQQQSDWDEKQEAKYNGYVAPHQYPPLPTPQPPPPRLFSLENFVNENPELSQPPQEQQQQQFIPEQKHYTTSCKEEKALVLFNEALQKQLSLSTVQVFDWVSYFTTTFPAAPGNDASIPVPESILFRQFYQMPSFVIQYALVKIRVFCPNKKHSFYNIILNSRARTQLFVLIDIIWEELSVNRGSKYTSVRALRSNIELMKATLQWFFTHPVPLPPDDNWDNIEHRVFPIYAVAPDNVPIPRSVNDEFRSLVAQACFVNYEQAIEMNATAECVLDQFEQKLSLAARKAFTVLLGKCGKERSNETANLLLLQQILEHQNKKVLFAKLIANYFAEAQVLSATAAMNKPVATIRCEETIHILNTLANYSTSGAFLNR